MANKRDYYTVLGISKTATDDDIKHAYRLLAKKYHPDVSDDPDAEAKFKEITEAKEILLSYSKRWLYDHYGFDGLEKGFVPPREESQNSGDSYARSSSYWSDRYGDSRYSDAFTGSSRASDSQRRANSYDYDQDRHYDYSDAFKEGYDFYNDRYQQPKQSFFKRVVTLVAKAIDHYRTSSHVSVFHKITYLLWMVYLKAKILQEAHYFSEGYFKDWGWPDVLASCDAFKWYVFIGIGVQLIWWIWRKRHPSYQSWNGLWNIYVDKSGSNLMGISIIIVLVLWHNKINADIPIYMYFVPCLFAGLIKF